MCGKASLEQLELRGCPVIPSGPEISAETIYSLPEKLREAQGLFDATGGLHAAALFDAEGNLLALREDVGRHNATDKLVGWALMEGKLPLNENIVMVSGTEQLRDPSEVPHRRGTDSVRHLRAQQPRRGRRPAVRYDASGVLAKQSLQRVRWHGENPHR